MLIAKVQKILVDNKYGGKFPKNMTQLAAAVGFSDKHVRELIKRGLPEDIRLIAQGLRVSPDQLSS